MTWTGSQRQSVATSLPRLSFLVAEQELRRLAVSVPTAQSRSLVSSTPWPIESPRAYGVEHPNANDASSGVSGCWSAPRREYLHQLRHVLLRLFRPHFEERAIQLIPVLAGMLAVAGVALISMPFVLVFYQAPTAERAATRAGPSRQDVEC